MARRTTNERAERAAIERDEAAQERGEGAARAQRVATDYVHTTHPETGRKVVFVPGEALPEWVDLKAKGTAS